MNSIEELKEQLLLQKSAIEAKGGTVTVAGTNPSPAEITAGINTIPSASTTSANSISVASLKADAQTFTIEDELALMQAIDKKEANATLQAGAVNIENNFNSANSSASASGVDGQSLENSSLSNANVGESQTLNILEQVGSAEIDSAQSETNQDILKNQIQMNL